MAAFDPHEFLAKASSLACGTDECSLRTAVNRSYYAVFLIARERLGVTQTERAHEAVRDRLRRRNNGERLARQMEQLYKLRTTADYDLDPQDPAYQNWRANWQRALGWANKLLPIVERL